MPALAIISALIWESDRGQRAAMRAELANTARAIAGLVDTEVERSHAMLQTFAATRSLRDRDWDVLDATARHALPDSKRWLVVVDMNGRQIVNTRVSRGALIPAIPLDPEYVAAMRAGQSFVSGMVLGAAAQALVVHVGQPVRYPNGELVGVSIVMTPDTVGEALKVRRYAPDGVVSVVDRQGKIINRNPDQKEFIGALATPDMVQAIVEQREGAGDSVTLEGIPVLTAIARANCGWSVLLGMPRAKIFAGTRRLMWIGVSSALAVTLGAITLATLLARMVVREVDGLAQDAERLARGEPTAGRTSELHEITLVADAMRRMATTKNETEAQLREARDRLRDYAQELEQKVEQRTASLRDAVTQMEEFSYTVSHDLRAPLRAMSGFGKALLEDYSAALPPEAQEHLRRIVRASERMNRLTTDLLDYSRVARADLHCTRVRLEPLLRATIEHYGELHAGCADIVLQTPLHDVRAHETSLTQALANLLTNAAKFVRPGERPRITVRTERRSDRVRVWVEDNGIGIPPQHQGRLFRIFERTESSKNYDGTGVGLAIVRKIVDKMGGTCGLESDGKSGSRFWIELSGTDAIGRLEPSV